jgi:lipoprotein NlpD
VSAAGIPIREVGLKFYQLTVLVFVSSLLLACSSPRQRAPVEDKSPTARPSNPAASAPTPKVLPGAEHAGKPGYYTVKPGDTLARIGLEVGQNWRDVARWNGIENPNLIEVGQVLRVFRPGSEPLGQAPSVAAAPTAPQGSVSVNPIGSPARTDARALEAKPEATPATPTPPTAAPAATVPSASSSSEEDVVWGWPAGGTVVATFDEMRTKGLVIAGQAGESVLAAANGRVVYVGAELRGYGNLVIIKHNNTFLTAYAHNQAILVKEEQIVRRGQKIAEMGSSDAARVQLHFEVRRLGKPIDPMKVLPAR